MFGVFGNTLEQAKRSEFFVWFHLDETARDPEGDFTKLRFQPTGQQVRDLVAIEMIVDREEHLQAASLTIHRSFIDHAESATLAADITKSFLVAALDRIDVEMVTDAAMQIRRYQPAGTRMQISDVGGQSTVEIMEKALIAGKSAYASNLPGASPLLPGEGEPEYLTYAGKRRKLERMLQTAQLSMSNESVDGVEQLRIAIKPK